LLVTSHCLSSTFNSLPAEKFEWLSYTDMLTEKLRKTSAQVEMIVLSHEWVPSNWWERHVLHLNGMVIRRDILMQAEGKPRWFARTMIPEATYQRDPTFFDRLHQEPLGKLIFNEPRVVRRMIHSYGIDGRHLELYWLNRDWFKNDESLWMRISFLELMPSAPFYLAEIFLS
jgi:chorismate--pyruvate lyase